MIWIALLSLQNGALLDVPWLQPIRLLELVGMAVFALGVATPNERVHALIAGTMVLSMLVMIAGIFFRSAPLL